MKFGVPASMSMAMLVFAQACSMKTNDPGGGSSLGADSGLPSVTPKVSSGFASNDDGWTISGDAQATSVKPDYSGTGGNPDGLIGIQGLNDGPAQIR